MYVSSAHSLLNFYNQHTRLISTRIKEKFLGISGIFTFRVLWTMLPWLWKCMFLVKSGTCFCWCFFTQRWERSALLARERQVSQGVVSVCTSGWSLASPGQVGGRVLREPRGELGHRHRIPRDRWSDLCWGAARNQAHR